MELYTALVRERHYYIDFLELIKIIHNIFRSYKKLDVIAILMFALAKFTFFEFPQELIVPFLELILSILRFSSSSNPLFSLSNPAPLESFLMNPMFLIPFVVD